MKQIIPIFVFFMIFSCNKVGVSKVESESVDKVLEFYGGQINKSIGFKAANGKKINYFELQISKSQLLNSDQNYLSEQAANIAYIFYSNLKNEKSNYDEIRVKIDLENGESREYKFPIVKLKEFEIIFPEIEKTNTYIRAGEYKLLAKQMSKKIGATEAGLKNLFENLQSNFGNVKQIHNQGFNFLNDKEFGDFIRVKEVVNFEKVAGIMILSYDRKTKELIGIDFP